MSGSVLLQVASWAVDSRPISSLLAQRLNKATPSKAFLKCKWLGWRCTEVSIPVLPLGDSLLTQGSCLYLLLKEKQSPCCDLGKGVWRLQQELSTAFSLSGVFRDVSCFLSLLQEAEISVLSSHLLPVPQHHHLMAPVLDLERNIKQELYLLHRKKFTAM